MSLVDRDPVVAAVVQLYRADEGMSLGEALVLLATHQFERWSKAAEREWDSRAGVVPMIVVDER